MGLRDKIENHAAVVFLGALFIGASTGVGVYQAVVSASGRELVATSELTELRSRPIDFQPDAAQPCAPVPCVEIGRSAHPERPTPQTRPQPEPGPAPSNTPLDPASGANNPDVQALFGVFLNKGFWKLGTPNSTWRHDYPKRGSYNALVRSGVLDDFESFLAAVTGEHRWGNNDRPIWPKAGTEERAIQYRQSYDIFVEMAPRWRAMGLLEP